MKRVIFFFVLLFPILLNAQSKWDVTIGYPSSDEYLNSILELYDEGVLIGAYSEIIESTSWVIKTDVNGEILYNKEFLHEKYELSIDAIATDSTGNIYTGGSFYPEGGALPYVIKLDSCGQLMWCKLFPLAPYSIGGGVDDVLFNKNNKLLIVMSYSTGNQGDQIYMACLDENGNELWYDSYAKKSDYPLMVNPIAIDILEHNNEYYISGYCYFPYPGNPNHVYLRPLFIGVDATFEEKWVLPFYALDSVYGWSECIIPLNDSVIMGAGIRLATNGEEANSLLMFVNTDGEEFGYNQISNEQIGPDIVANWILDIERVNDTLFMAATFYGPNSGANPVGAFVIDTGATLYNYKSRPNTITKPKMIKTLNKDFIVATTVDQGNHYDILLYKIDENLNSVPFDTTHHTYDSLCPHTIQSGEMDLTDCLVITGIEDWPTPAQYYESIRWIPIKAYPNPVTEGKLTLEFENTKHHQYMELRCYDDFGRQVHDQKIYKGQQDADVDVSGWPPGIYIAVVYSEGSARGKAKFVVR